MVKNIIFFIKSPFNKRDFDRFGIDILESKGFRVEAWDFTSFLNPLLQENYVPPDSYLWSNLRIFESRQDATSSISKLNSDETLVVSFLGFTVGTILIYRSLSFSNIGYGFIFPSGLTSVEKSSLLSLVVSRLSRLVRQPSLLIDNVLTKLIDNVLTKILPFPMLGIKPAKFVSVPGLGFSFPKLVNEKTNIIHSCSFDFNYYIDSIDSNEIDDKLDLNESQFIVFLDEFLPFHPDYLDMNIDPPCTPDQYYPALIHFFDAIELALGREVVIAAHPRSSYDRHPDYFDGRKTFFGKTHQLVKQSKCVITHGSTSVNFAVIYKKPIFFTNFDVLQRYKELPLYDFYESMAKSLSKQPIIIDRPLDVDWQSEMVVNLNAYQRYCDLYIKSPLAPEKNSWQIFADYAFEIQ